jgi:MoxR-like ATPase
MPKNVNAIEDIPTKILAELNKVVVGKNDIKQMLLVTLFSEGHILIEGLPGTAKTLLAKTFAQTLGGQFKRIQFTPDMLPTDVTGFNVYSPDGRSRFVAGAIFANVVLADELNRTTPRTQAALLEAMQEKQVTIEGASHPLSNMFMVIASQLPYGTEGTYPLTEVQADRFMFRVWSDYLSKEDEQQVISKMDYIENPNIHAAVSLDQVMELQQKVKKIHVSNEVASYIVSIIQRAREDPDVAVGPSTRATVSLFKGSRALAFLEGRDYVLPDDIKKLVYPALFHRIRVKPEAEMENVTSKIVIDRIIGEISVPK